ncbi:MAG: CYTH domain-containing protein [Flectobacillus sp.]|nr:CYTH domain-containing protein [Flectobacillus sp.]
MGVEIERKFLVKHSLWDAFEKPKGEYYRQGYLLTDPNKTIRVRATDSAGYITIKGRTVGASRPEFEYQIPKEEAISLLDTFTENNIEKTRYTIPHEGNTWEVDVFYGQNLGLIVAEIELTSEDETFICPDWVAEEVTSDARYYNSKLSIMPFLHWI